MGSLPGDFTTAAARSGADTGFRIEVEGSRIRGLSVPIRSSDLPGPVARTVDQIQPDGTTEAVAQLWTESGSRFSVTTRYDGGLAPRRRTLVMDDSGVVLERSHQISLPEVSPAGRRAIAELNHGTIEEVEVVQRGPGEEAYRFALLRPDGRQYRVECRLDGTGLQVARVLTAELHAHP